MCKLYIYPLVLMVLVQGGWHRGPGNIYIVLLHWKGSETGPQAASDICCILHDPKNVAEVCYNSQISLKLVCSLLPYFMVLMSVPVPCNARTNNFLMHKCVIFGRYVRHVQ